MTSDELRDNWSAFEARARQIEWRHIDGSVCPEALNDRLTTSSGDLWWCTTHQSHLTGTRREL